MARKQQVLGGCAEGAAEHGRFLRLYLHRRGGETRVAHLARHEALPDEAVDAHLLCIEHTGEALGRAHGAGRADGLVGFLGAARAGLVDALFRGHELGAPASGHVLAGLAAGDGRDVERVGSHIGDEADRA